MNTLEKVENFIIQKYFGFKLDKKIDMQTTLSNDLGIEGDDAVIFFEKFDSEFKIDLTGLDLNKYFHGEGFNPFSLILNLFFRKNKYPLKVGDLVHSIEVGKWTDPDKTTT